MKRILIAAVFAFSASGAAYAQDPASQPDANAVHPPESRMEQATPQTTAPEGQKELAPTNRVGETVPPMKATEPQTSAGAEQSAFSPTLILTEDEAKGWLGRAVYSSDGKELGEIASLQRDPENKVTEIYADFGGFLGFGETRVRIAADQVQDVKPNSIVLKLSAAQADSLPVIDNSAVQD